MATREEIDDTGIDKVVATTLNGAAELFNDNAQAIADHIQRIDGNVQQVADQQTELTSDLAGKADLVHSHVIDDVTGLQSALDTLSEGTVDSDDRYRIISAILKINDNGPTLSTGNIALDLDDLGVSDVATYYSSDEQSKLSGIATGATANQTDAYLLDRAHHTGSQSIGSVDDLTEQLSALSSRSHVALTLGTANGLSLSTQTLSLAAATTSTPGAMTAAQATKLNGIATGATANSSDATLLNRANHTGTQSYTTITGLGTASLKNTGLTSGTIPVWTAGVGGIAEIDCQGNKISNADTISASQLRVSGVIDPSGSGFSFGMFSTEIDVGFGDDIVATVTTDGWNGRTNGDHYGDSYVYDPANDGYVHITGADGGIIVEGSLTLEDTINAPGANLNGAANVSFNTITTPTDGFTLSANSSATSGATVKMSPRLRFSGNAWKSNSTAVSQTHDWTIENLPATGAASTTSTLRFGYSFNVGSYSYPLTINSSGTTTVSALSAGSITCPGGSQSERFGAGATASGVEALAVGYGASGGSQTGATCLGFQAYAYDYGFSTAIGSHCQVRSFKGTAVGAYAYLEHEQATTVGFVGRSFRNYAVSFGAADTQGADPAVDYFGRTNDAIRQMHSVDLHWINYQDNTRTTQAKFKMYDGTTSTVNAREFMCAEANGSAVKLSFFGATAVTQQAANADTSGATLSQLETEVNELKALLRNYGLLAP